jgi:hypothetical protein
LLGLDRATGRQVAPEVVDFFLILAVDLKRNRSLNLNSGPPLRPVKVWPSSSKLTVITAPSGLP